MKKGLLGLVVLGAIAGTVAYKLKKNQQEKELLDEELEILSGVETEENTEETEETSNEDSEEPDEIVTEVLEETEEPEELFEDAEEAFEELEEFEETCEKLEEAIEDTEELDEEIYEYDFSDKFEEIAEEIEDNSTEEIISEEIIENPFIEETEDDYKIEFESNDEVIEEFDENIDNFEERPVQHTIDFKSVEDMETYKQVVIEKGYVVTRGENPYQLSVLHIAPSNKRELLVNVYYLANQAVKYNGSYQGWQSRKVL